MSKVTVEEALRKGKMQLMWIPMMMLFALMFAGIALFAYSISMGITVFISSFIAPWIWWSVRVVKWKIWAFSNVTDLKVLEKKAIAQQLIWPQGNWFEKTEIKSSREKKQLEQLYQKINNSTFTKEPVQDNTLPIQTVIKYPRINIYFYLLMIPLGIYLIYIDSLFLGIASIVSGGWMAFDLYRKVAQKKFLLKLDHTGVALSHTFLPWNEIEEYFIERSGYGKSTTFSLIIRGTNFHESISLSDVNKSPDAIERYMDVYRSRFELMNQVIKS